jgi:hypothetical protein
LSKLSQQPCTRGGDSDDPLGGVVHLVDLRDAAPLLTLGDRQRVVRDVEAHIGDVRPDVRAAWLDLLA